MTEWALDPVAEMSLNAADLVLAVGVQWGSEETQLLRRFSSKPCVHIDVDRGYPARGHRPSFRLIGNVKTIVSELVGSVAPRRNAKKGASLADQVSDVNAVHWKITKSIIRERERAKPIYPGLVGAELAKVADRNAIVVLDGSSTSTWILDVYAKERSSMLVWPGAYGSIGFAFPASIAAKAVHPDRQVIAVIDDGGFLMSYMDMSTALENDLPITVVVTNNQTYGDIWHIQRRGYNARYIGTDLPSVNYAELARSFGAVGIRVEEPSMLGEACRDALGSGRFTVIDVVTDVHYPFLGEEIQERLAHPSKE